MNFENQIPGGEISLKQQKPTKRRQFFANHMHREIFFIVLAATLIPMFVTAIGLFYLIFNITAEQIGFPEAIAYNIIPAAKKVTLILFVITPPIVALILWLAHKITHRIVGPFDRIVRELDQRLDTKRRDPVAPIKLRPGDKFQPLVDRINELLKR